MKIILLLLVQITAFNYFSVLSDSMLMAVGLYGLIIYMLGLWVGTEIKK